LSRVGQFTRNLTAPDPRSREVSTEPAVFAAAESSVSSVATKPVPEPRATIAVVSRSERQAGAETPAANQPLQPLVLTKIDDRRSRHTDPAAAALPAALPGVIQSRFADAAESGAPPARFRETRLRTTEAPKKTGNRFLNWSQFPSQVR